MRAHPRACGDNRSHCDGVFRVAFSRKASQRCLSPRRRRNLRKSAPVFTPSHSLQICDSDGETSKTGDTIPIFRRCRGIIEKISAISRDREIGADRSSASQTEIVLCDKGGENFAEKASCVKLIFLRIRRTSSPVSVFSLEPFKKISPFPRIEAAHKLEKIRVKGRLKRRYFVNRRGGDRGF